MFSCVEPFGSPLVLFPFGVVGVGRGSPLRPYKGFLIHVLCHAPPRIRNAHVTISR